MKLDMKQKNLRLQQKVADLEFQLKAALAGQAHVYCRAESALKKLKFLNDNPDMVFHLGSTWYYREGYLCPHRKAKDLIEAIDKIMGAKNAT